MQQPPPLPMDAGPPPLGAAAGGASPGVMSQGATTSMLLNSASLDPQLRALIEADRGNQECADCDYRNPTWASYNIGIFICENCCGVHRGIVRAALPPRAARPRRCDPAR